jgi:hypothetical protein
VGIGEFWTAGEWGDQGEGCVLVKLSLDRAGYIGQGGPNACSQASWLVSKQTINRSALTLFLTDETDLTIPPASFHANTS